MRCRWAVRMIAGLLTGMRESRDVEATRVDWQWGLHEHLGAMWLHKGVNKG